MHSIVARLGGPVAHVARAIALIIAFNLSLRRTLDGETCIAEVQTLIRRLIEDSSTDAHSRPGSPPRIPTSVPMVSTMKSADFPTMPVLRPGPQALTFWKPASGPTITSKGLQHTHTHTQNNPPRLPRQSWMRMCNVNGHLRGAHWHQPAWDGMASPSYADCVLARLERVIFTFINTISCISYLHLLLCAS